MTDRPSETGTAFGLQQSQVDATPVPVRTSGTSRMRLTLPTGEVLASLCSAHYEWTEGCDLCSKGIWVWPV